MFKEGTVQLKFSLPLEKPSTLGRIDKPWADGTLNTAIGEVPRVSTTLLFSDRVGTWKARWGIGRMKYTVMPGLYAVGNPTPESPVLVTANYKMSFDALRSALGSIDAWILVLDTKGINVWCAAGKGTFGTDEMIRRIRSAGLKDIVTHKTLIVPQLGAPGVSAHEVRKSSGFRVKYGPVRASDLPRYLSSGFKANAGMRRVHFPTKDRIALIPMELVPGMKYLLPIMAAFFLLSGLGPDGYAIDKILRVGPANLMLILGAFLAGTVITPALLPWVPGRAFSVKGALLGLMLFGLAVMFQPGVFANSLSAVAWALIMPTLASFMAMNFTGSTTFTSLSGVLREMRLAVPAQITGAIIGTGMWIGSLFV